MSDERFRVALLLLVAVLVDVFTTSSLLMSFSFTFSRLLLLLGLVVFVILGTVFTERDNPANSVLGKLRLVAMGTGGITGTTSVRILVLRLLYLSFDFFLP